MSTVKLKKKKAKKHAAPKHEVIFNRIEEFRVKKGLGQGELAVAADLHKSHLCKIESGERKQISLPVAVRLAKVLGTNVETLFKCN